MADGYIKKTPDEKKVQIEKKTKDENKLQGMLQGITNPKIISILVVGIVAMIGVTFWPLNKNQTVTPTIKQVVTSDEGDYASTLEKRLVNILSKMEGVGNVSVMITIETNEEKILAENTTFNNQRTEEKDQAGGMRITDNQQQSRDVFKQSNNTPYVVKECAPKIRGVFIVAEGAGNDLVKSQITDAVSKLLDVPVHKISVEKKKN